MTKRKLLIESLTIPLSRTLIGLCVLLVLGSSGATLQAQTFQIRVLNGRNGRPIANKCTDVAITDKANLRSGTSIETQTDSEGIIKIRLTEQDAELNDQNQRLVCGVFGVLSPVAKYGDTIGIRPFQVFCQEHTPDFSWLGMKLFSTTQVFQDGIATENTCGHVKATAAAGEIILFVRPLTWWEIFKE
jgi:hypothetical protein